MDSPREKMPIAHRERQTPLSPRQRLHRRLWKSFLSRNLEAIHWEKKNVRYSGSVSHHQKRTVVIILKAKVALQAQRIEDLSNRLRKCEQEKQELEDFLDKTDDDAADMERKLALALEKAADTEAELAQRESNHRDAMNNLNHECEKLLERTTKLEVQFAACEDTRLKSQPLANSSKVSDESITAIWAKMQYNIDYLANHVLTGCPQERDLKDGSISDSCFLSSNGINDSIEQLQDEDMRAFVVEHYIWEAVIGRFFDTGVDGTYGKAWAGTIGMCFTTCIEKLISIFYRRQMEPTRVFNCKAEIGDMIGQLIGIDEAELLRVEHMEIMAFAKFIPTDCSGYQAKVEKLYKNIHKIFDNALELRAIFMASKAYFYTDWCRKRIAVGARIRFEDKSMKAEAWEKEPRGNGSTVLLNISPALMKVGTADGDSYGSDLMLVKARVVCD
ncbi:hypothetical protein SGCOL_011066 [Colletotrichum sp. CLE4]